MQLPDERAALVDYCRRMQADDLTVGTSGNLSVRSGDLIAITPSGVPYEDLTPEAICVIDLAGQVVEADLDPSSEVPMHTSVYRATDAGAVVHTHPLYCTALSVLLDALSVGVDHGADFVELLRRQQRRLSEQPRLVVEPAHPFQVDRTRVRLGQAVAVGGGAVVAEEYAGAVLHRGHAVLGQLRATETGVGRHPHRAAQQREHVVHRRHFVTKGSDQTSASRATKLTRG